MTTATVKYIANGYTVQSFGGAGGVPASLYAATIPEVVYWLGKLFDPYAAAAAATKHSSAPAVAAQAVSVLNNQEAQVSTIESGGFIVRENPNFATGVTQAVDTWCVNMDAVANELTRIFTEPPPADPVAQEA